MVTVSNLWFKRFTYLCTLLLYNSMLLHYFLLLLQRSLCSLFSEGGLPSTKSVINILHDFTFNIIQTYKLNPTHTATNMDHWLFYMALHVTFGPLYS